MWQNLARGKLENSLTNIFIPFFWHLQEWHCLQNFWEFFLINLVENVRTISGTIWDHFFGQFHVQFQWQLCGQFLDSFRKNYMNNFRDKFLLINLVENVRTIWGTFSWGISGTIFGTISWAVSVAISRIILWSISGSMGFLGILVDKFGRGQFQGQC